MFVVDDLVGWLVGRLADAGYQKLSTRLRGSDTDRELKKAVAAAVQATVGEIGPSDGAEAERVAERINKAFRRREPVPLSAGQLTLLVALQAGIAGQLRALDDAGQPAVSLPGVQVGEVAAKLTGHLVREIMIRGSQPGPLTPLADQLNHDLTHLQAQRIEGRGQRIEGMLAQLTDRLGDAPTALGSAAGPAGLPLAEVGDPFALEVHRPVEPDEPHPGLPVLPVYVPREHDAALAQIVTEAAAGAGGIAVLVGGSSTGKTRACWQALELLRQAGVWRLWHPVDPQAALAQLAGVGPRTVVWLNEAQRYLDTPGGTGERVAAGLRELVRDRARGPALVLATLWWEYWDELTARPQQGEDLHAQARELLVGRDIHVPAAFTGEQLQELERSGDPRLAQAAAGSQDRQVIQYLAGAPDLLDRYDNAPPAPRALINAAMDARRLGMRPALPLPFLEAAAPGYMTDADWNRQPRDWLKPALEYTVKFSKGVRGPLAPIRPRPAPAAPAGNGQAWQLADYLDEHGRNARRELIPPEYFWGAAASYADPADLGTLGEAAGDRGLYRNAAQLRKNAAARISFNDPQAVIWLLDSLRNAGAAEQVSALAERAAAGFPLDDPFDVVWLMDRLRDAGAAEQVSALLHRGPAAHVCLDDPAGVAWLLDSLRNAGAAEQVSALLHRGPAAHVCLDDPGGVAWLLDSLGYAGAEEQVSALAKRAAAHVSLDDPGGVTFLLYSLRIAGAAEQVSALLHRGPAAHVSLDDPFAVAQLLDSLRDAGAAEQVSALAERAADHIPLDNMNAVVPLLDWLRDAGRPELVSALAERVLLDDPRAVALLLDWLLDADAAEQVSALLHRDPAAHVSLDDPDAVASLLDSLWKADPAMGRAWDAGEEEQVSALLHRDPAAHVSLDDPRAVTWLLGSLRKVGRSARLMGRPWDAGAEEQVSALAKRAAAHVSLDDPGGVALLLDWLRDADAAEQVSALLHREPAAHVCLDDPGGVAWLLGSLRNAGAAEQVSALLHRGPAAHVSLDDPGGVASLRDSLRNAGAAEQATALAERLPGAGMFELFCALEGCGEKFRYGREADGRPAKRWAWTDLD